LRHIGGEGRGEGREGREVEVEVEVEGGREVEESGSGTCNHPLLVMVV
jgi:hypothetical protein